MPRSDRLLRLLQAMRMMRAPITAKALAEETEVSLRTLYRDIDSLRASGAQIEGERGYGYRLIEDHSLPPQMFDRSEVEAMALGLSAVAQIGDQTLEKAASSVLSKIAATLPYERERQLLHAVSKVFRQTISIGHCVDMDIVRSACWEEVALQIKYKDIADNQNERIILPLAIMYAERSLTILAWCCLRDDFRMFRVDRIQSIIKTKQSFRPRRVALLRDYLSELTREITDDHSK